MVSVIDILFTFFNHSTHVILFSFFVHSTQVAETKYNNRHYLWKKEMNGESKIFLFRMVLIQKYIN